MFRAIAKRPLFRSLVCLALVLGACSPPPTVTPLAPSIRLEMSGPSSVRSVLLLGSGPTDSTIELYADERCASLPLMSVSAAALASGVRVEAAPNTTTLFTARATLNGVFSPCSAPAVFVHDDIAPATPSLVSVMGLGGLPPHVKISGLADRGTRVRVFTDETCATLGKEVRAADGDGKFELELEAMANAVTHFTARALDAAGNASGCSPSLSFAHDELPPAAPRFVTVTPASPSRVALPTVTGEAEAGSTVRFFFDAACTASPAGTLTADANGTFTVQLAMLTNALNRVYAVAIDASGNRSPCGGPLLYEHDDLPPTVFFGATSPASPSRTATAFTMNVTTSENAFVEVFTTADCSGAPATGVISVTPDVGLPTSARATDAVGNVSSCTTGPVLLNDTTAPGAPVITSSLPGSPSRTSQYPVLLGTAEAGGTLRLYRTANCTSTATAYTVGANGQFSASTSVSTNTTGSFTATVTDLAGNVSLCSAPFTFTHDNRAPTAATLWGTLPPSPIRTSGPVRVLGLAEAGAMVSVYALSGCLGAPTTVTAGSAVNINGQGSFAASLNLLAGSGSTTVSAIVSDAAGNTSACSSPLTLLQSTTRGWSEDAELGFSSGLHQFPTVALTPAGDAVAIFGRSASGTAGVFRTERVAGTWSAPVSLTDTGSSAIMTSPPRAVSDASGTVLLGWNAQQNASLARRANDGSWTTQALGASDYGRSPDVALDGNGNGLVAFERFVTSTVRVLARRSSGATWEAESTLSDPAYSSFEPRVSAAGNRSVVAFARNTGSGSSPRDELWTSTAETGLPFAAPTQRSSVSALFDRRDARIGMSSTGEATGVWLQSSQSLGPWTLTTAATTTGSWSTPNSLSSTTTSQREFDAVVLPSGEALALWRLNSTSLQFARRPAGATWSAAVTVPGSSLAVSPRLVGDETGRFVAVWKTLDAYGGGGQLWFSTYTYVPGWSTPQLLDVGVGSNDTFSLALDSTGRAVAVWTRAQGTDTVVRTRSLQ